MATLFFVGAVTAGFIGFIIGTTNFLVHLSDRATDKQLKSHSSINKENDSDKKQQLISEYEKKYKLKYCSYEPFGVNHSSSDEDNSRDIDVSWSE